MNAILPSGRAGSALALALLLVLLLIGWLAGVAPLLAWHAEEAEALARRQTLHRRMEGIAAALPALQLAAAAPSLDSAKSALLEGGTDAVAGAALQEMVRDMAGRTGATLFSVETLIAVPSGAYRRIGLRLSLAAPWPVLMRLLQAIEQARPRMVIDDLELRQSQLRTGEEDALLNAAFTLYAFRHEAEQGRAP